MLDASYYEKADEIIAQYSCGERSLIPIIQEIQEEYRYLPPELLTYVAGKIGISEAKAYSVARFYENFSFEAKGNMSLRSVTEQPVMCVNPCRYWKDFIKNLGLAKRNTQQMISYLP